MARRRTLGYVQNEWVCPNCSTRNKGGEKTCENCGAPQPENVQFELPSEQNFVKDDKQIQAAQAGADIHCGFCGTRNPATAETCSQCGADLKEGKAREAGRVMQKPAAQPKIVKCDDCGTENPSSNAVCSNCGSPLPKLSAAPAVLTTQKPVSGISPAAPLTSKKSSGRGLLIAGAVVACLAIVCIGVAALFFPTSSVQATVTDVRWQTDVPVQEIQPVRYNDERGNPPSGAYDVSCYDDSREVCEQRTIDRGNGYSEVVEECHTETDTFCSYTVDEWTTIQTYSLEGNDLRPIYDNPSLRSDQRIGNQSETLTVFFITEDGAQESYTPDSIAEFQQFTIGSTWTLNMNLAGGVVSVEP